jgi:hypothetical protein
MIRRYARSGITSLIALARPAIALIEITALDNNRGDPDLFAIRRTY